MDGLNYYVEGAAAAQAGMLPVVLPPGASSLLALLPRSSCSPPGVHRAQTPLLLRSMLVVGVAWVCAAKENE